MATTTKPKTPGRLDVSKLMAMTPPFIIRVERIEGRVSTPIALPIKDGETIPGAGWTTEEVMNLENWLLVEWTGGGYYKLYATSTTGEELAWEASWNPQQYPKKVPPTQQEAAISGAPVSVPPTQQQQPYTPIAQRGAWPPPASYFTQPQVAPPPPPQQAPQSQWPPSAALFYDPRTGLPLYQPQVPPYATQLQNFGRQPRDRDRDYRYREMERREREREEREEKARREQERKQYEEQIRRKDEELRQREIAHKEAEHKAALERQQQQYASEMAKMRDEIRRSSEKAREGENDEVRRAREEQQRLERERERDRIDQQFRMIQESMNKLAEKPTEDPRMRQIEQEMAKQREEARVQAERHERERDRILAQQAQEKLQQEARQQQEVLQRQMMEQERRTQEAIEKATMNRPDPIVEFMKENARMSQDNMRMQAETQREIARLNQASNDRMANMMMTPSALVSLIRDSGSSADTVLKSAVDTMSGMFGVVRQAAETVTRMTGGDPEPPAARLIQQGVERVSEMADRYIGMKGQQAMAEAQAEAAKAQAEAHVRAEQIRAQAYYQAQQQAQAAQAPRTPPVQQTTQTQRAPQSPPPEAATQGPTNGQSATEAAMAAAGLADAEPQPTATEPTSGPPSEAGAPPIDDGEVDPETGQTVAKNVPPKRLGKTDEQWFGVALKSIEELRENVNLFLENLEAHQDGEEIEMDEEGNIPGWSPTQAIDKILQGVNYVAAQRIEVPAFELLKQGRFAELMDVMIPDAPQPYRDDCTQILVNEVQIVQPPGVIDVTGTETPAG